MNRPLLATPTEVEAALNGAHIHHPTAPGPGLRLAIDMDDVLAEFFSTILLAAEAETGLALPYDEVTDWDDNHLKKVAFAGGADWWTWLETRVDVWEQAPPVPGAIEGIAALRARGHHIEVLTKKPEWAERVVWTWMAEHRPAVHAVNIVPVGVGRAKHTLSLSEVLVDDHLRNVEAWRAAGRTAILFTRPWNTHALDPYRADSWPEVVDLIDGMTP